VGKLHLSPAADRHGFDWKRLCESPHGVYSWDDVTYNDYLRFVERDLYPDCPEEAERLGGESERLNQNDSRFWLGWNWTDDAHHMTTWTGNETVNFLNTWEQRQPLFMNVSFFGPHHPYATCEPWDSMYDPAEIELPATLRQDKSTPIFERTKVKRQALLRKWDEALWREMIAKYYGNISQIDHQIGRILDALKARGMWDNTLIVFTSDHGDHMGDFGLLGKGDMYETSVKIPLIVKPPGGEKGRRAEHVVNSLDLFGTFLDAAGNTHWREDKGVEARSFLPLLDDSNAPWENETFSINGPDPVKNTVMFRKDNLKMIRLGLSADQALYELYDMNDAATDQRDVYDDPAYAGRREQMRERIDGFWAAQRERYPGQVRSFQNGTGFNA
jgi:arylsulfatase A-like enzyme